DREGSRYATAPLWEGSLARNGKHFTFRYVATGIADDFRARSGFISRMGVAHALATHRYTWFGAPGAKVESFTGDITLDNTWQYARFIRSGDAQDKKLHFSGNARLRGGWALGVGVFWETFGFDQQLYADYTVLAPDGSVLPFTGTPRIPNRDYVFTLSTPRWKRFNADLLYVGGQDENFLEWAQADINYLSAQLQLRPTDRVRVDGSLDYQDFWRRSDGTLAGRNVIPRVKLEYQLTRAVFVRAVGEYDRFEHADLRDETRTFYPLAIGSVPAIAMRDRSLHGDYLLSYRPTPGTVFFMGYGSVALGEPDAAQRYAWQPIIRRSDDLFVKLSYLFRP
ncbi:MAG TPA: hypothetical protein VJ867_11720, partial [Gemmatimonadaceae bacterium]|nr:hypothetical protein [Gemmatimonadaceae bacterium]